MFSIVWSDTTSGAMPLIVKCRSRNSIQLIQHEISRISCSTGELRTDSHAWEQRQLGESFNMLRNNTLSRADLSNDRKGVLDIHYGDVLIRYRAVVDVSTLQGPSINITNNRFLGDRLTDGDIIMADTAEDTSAGKCVEIEGIMHQNVVAGLHTIPLRPATPSSHGYWGQYLNSASFRNQLFPKMQGTKVISLSRTTVSNATVRYPSLAEQRRIGEFFTTLDNLIAAAERQEALLRRKKQAYLQLMFPRERETQPRLRFAGFRGEWERRQLSEVAEFSKGQGYSKADLCSSGTPTFLYGRMYTDYKLLITESDQYLPQNSDGVFSTAGDVIIPASGESPEEIAIASVIGKTGILLGGDLNIIKPERSVLDSIFLALSASVGRLHNNLVSRAQGKTIVHLHNSDIATCRIGFPSLPEQHCIGEFFTALESVIAAAEKRTESLHTLKSAYLQRMFV